MASRYARLLASLLAVFLGSACPAARNAVVEDSGTVRDGDTPPADAEAAPDGDAPTDGGDAGSTASDPSETWRRQVIYLVMTDRFFNGDESNDESGAGDCFDRDDAGLFHGGDLAGLRQQVAYLGELGVNALWLTPVYRQVGRVGSSCGYHGYWPDFTVPDDGALDGRLGSAADLEGLIADFGAIDGTLILDLIVNHSGYGARVTRSHPDWFHRSDVCADLGDSEIFCPLAGLPDFAQEDPAVADFLTHNSADWVRRFPIGGIRMDTAKHVPLDFFADHWIPAVRETRPGLFLIAEVFTGDSVSRYLPYLEAGFDSAFNFTMHGALLETFARGGSVDHVARATSDVISTLGAERALLMINFLNNHDLPRFMTEAGDVETVELAARYRLAMTALTTLPGVPQLYYGDELGMVGAWPENRRDMPSWAWSASAREAQSSPAGYVPEPASTFALTARLIELRNAHPALHDGYFSELWRQNGERRANVFAFFRGSRNDRVVVVLNNGPSTSGSLSMPFRENPGINAADRAALPDGTVFRDRLGFGAPATVTLEEGRFTIDLPPRTAGIYIPE